MRKFKRDLEALMIKICGDLNVEGQRKLNKLKEKLINLYERKLVKINHSVMELLCAKHLILKGYEVDVEHKLSDLLICDLFGTKGDGTVIVEVETGYTPPEHALDPATYNEARIISKIARYSKYSNKFSLGVPPFHIFRIPFIFTKPPKYREMEEVQKVKNLCDNYYKNPPVSLEEIRDARLHTIYIVDVDGGNVAQIDPESYLQMVSRMSFPI